jgi:hypothetical protein
MQELCAKLLKALGEGGPDSPAVQDLLREIDAKFPEQAWRARGMLDVFLLSTGAKPRSSDPPSGNSSWLSGKTVAMLLGGLGVGGSAVAGFNNIRWEDVQKPPLPDVTNQWILLAIVAVIGALVGVAHSFYRNNWSLVLPRMARGGGLFKVATFGFVRNMVVAATVSVFTTWIAFSDAVVAPADANAAPRAGPEKPKTTLLTWNVLFSVVVAGVVGSRMASGQVEVRRLWDALSITAESAPVPGLGKEVIAAKTPFEAIAATGILTPELKSTKETTAHTGIEEQLLALLDRSAVKADLAKLGKPLSTDGKGLTLAVLEVFQPLKPGLKSLLKDFEIPHVAKIDLDEKASLAEFIREADSRGIDRERFAKPLSDLHQHSRDVMVLLRKLPPTWSLGPERL